MDGAQRVGDGPGHGRHRSLSDTDRLSMNTQAQAIFRSSLASPSSQSSDNVSVPSVPSVPSTEKPSVSPSGGNARNTSSAQQPTLSCVQVAKFNGRWEGMSVPWNKAKEKTWWTDCHFMFTPHPGDPLHYKIKGNGTSVWRKETIMFQVVGTFNADTLRFELFKTHTGKYTNTIQFYGHLQTAGLSLHGEYRDGSLSLVRVDSPSVESPGTPTVLPRALSSPMDGRSRNSSASNPDMSPQQTVDPLEASSLHRQVSPHNATLTESEAVARVLTGTWEGESTRTATGAKTQWRNCVMQFSIVQNHSGVVVGQGQSLWRGESIPFLVEGSFDARQLTVRLVKTHISKWTNSVEYTCTVDMGRCTLDGTYRNGSLKLNKIKGVHGMRCSTMFGYLRDECIVASHGNHDSPTVLDLTGASQRASPPVSPVAKAATGSMSRSPRHATMGETADYMTPLAADSKSKTATLDEHSLYQAYLASGVATTDTTAAHRMGLGQEAKQLQDRSDHMKIPPPTHTRMAVTAPANPRSDPSVGTYRVFLEALMSSGSINSTQFSAYRRYRAQHNVTDDIHAMALAQLGVSPQQFLAMRSDESEADTCKICFDNKINTVLLPCGHFTCCSECSRSLSKCPVCRQSIVEAKVVYRA